MTLNCKGQLIDLTRPKVMGILNVTPDSFYDGGRFTEFGPILNRVGEMLADGADFIDVGGYSSRPGAAEVSAHEEMDRVIPVIQKIIAHYPQALITVDTFRADVARAAIEQGACMVNDISGGLLDAQMLKTVAQLQVPYIMMHMKGNPQNMQQQAQYQDIVKEMLFYFSQRIAQAREWGINDLVIDPGFGFAKTIAHNFEVLSKLELFQITGLPIVAGLSRKSMIYKTLGLSADEALNGTTALHMVALAKGAAMLRVHDVKEAVQCIRLQQALIGGGMAHS